MKKIFKKILSKIKINKKVENIIVLLFFIVFTVIGYIANALYRQTEINDSYDKVELAFELENQKLIYNENNMMNGLEEINYLLTKDKNIDNFYEYVKLTNNYFEECDYVGILQNGMFIKDYFPNGQFSIDSSETGFTFYKLASYTNEKDHDVYYFVDTNNNVCVMMIKPIYFDYNDSPQYFGELIARINLSNLVKEYTKIEDYGFTKNAPYKISYEFKDGTILNIATCNLSKLTNPITINIKNSNTTIVYTTSSDALFELLSTNSMRFVVLFVVLAIASLGLKFFFATIRKQSAMEQLNDTKLDFFTNIIYEVRTSTNSIVGFCNEAEKEQLSQNTRGYLASSKLELKKLLHKINNILDITNLSEGKQNLYEEEYYLHMLIQEIVDEYKSEIEERDLKLIVDISNSLPIKLLGQRNVIKKAICHLLDSSLSSIIDGHIKISIYGNYVSQNRKLINLKIIVTDTGIGIKEDTVKDVFLVDSVKDNASDDIKVELAIASELCKTIGGKLKITSDFGKGTVCTIDINQKVIDDRMMTDEMLQGLKEKYRKNLGKLKKVHANILIVDDNDVNLSVLRNIIKLYGAEVDSAKTGRVAEELALVKNYDLLFIDYLMPEIDGYETLKRIRNINKRYSQVPAVLVSANTFNKESDFKDAGFNDYLQKPIVQRDVERAIKSLLNIELLECEINDEINY